MVYTPDAWLETGRCRLQRATSKAVQYCTVLYVITPVRRRAPLRVSVTQLTEIQTTGYYLVHLLMCDKCAHRDQRSLRVNDLKSSGYLRRGAWTVWVLAWDGRQRCRVAALVLLPDGPQPIASTDGHQPSPDGPSASHLTLGPGPGSLGSEEILYRLQLLDGSSR